MLERAGTTRRSEVMEVGDRRSRGVLLALALALSLGGSVGLGSAKASALPAVRTAVLHFQPFLVPSGVHRGYKVLGTAKGYCWESSLATSRRDAYRCYRGNALYDPCFRNHALTRVACAVSINPKRIFILKLTKPLPDPGIHRLPRAFALVVKGKSCWYDTGATYSAGGKRANFGCHGGTWLFGSAKSHHEPWKIQAGSGLHPRLRWVSVETAWF